MEPTPDGGVTVLTADECWRLLASADVGRLAVVIAGEPEIFPINFVVDGQSLVFRTAEGTKLYGITVSPRVALEADGYLPHSGEAWSVVVKGMAEQLDRFPDIYAAQELGLSPWQAGTKPWYVRIVRTTLTGFKFTVARGPRED
jgi:hypothetical protein